ncbi:MAG: N-acetylmuramidase domain-containing protein [Alphaproteobacteria bacterium]
MIDFVKSGNPLSEGDWTQTLQLIGAESSALWSLLSVETSGSGFLPDRRPKILFERHYFHRLTNGKFDEDHPDISAPSAGGYGPAGAHQYERLETALSLDESAALQSASWGLGQIMGTHFEKLEYGSPQEMVESFVQSEGDQLQGIAKFLIAEGLDKALKDKNWAELAKGYNGPNYAINQYDTKLASFYDRFSKGRLPDLSVRAAQLYLIYKGYSISVDGVFGPSTSKVLQHFQTDNNLPTTGQLDDETLTALAT